MIKRMELTEEELKQAVGGGENAGNEQGYVCDDDPLTDDCGGGHEGEVEERNRVR